MSMNVATSDRPVGFQAPMVVGETAERLQTTRVLRRAAKLL